MAATDTIGLLVKVVVVFVLVYFIYDYMKTPLYLMELTQDYNELVDQFHLALKETAIAYIHIGSKSDCMPVTIQMRTIDGVFVQTKQSTLDHPKLYVPGNDSGGTVLPFSVFGYIRNDRVYIHRMTVRISYTVQTGQSTDQTYIFDTKLNMDDDRTTDTRKMSHPATWIHENDIDENQYYQLVVNPAGLFTMVRIESFKHVEGIPTTPPEYREYTKTLTGINRK